MNHFQNNNCKWMFSRLQKDLCNHHIPNIVIICHGYLGAMMRFQDRLLFNQLNILADDFAKTATGTTMEHQGL